MTWIKEEREGRIRYRRPGYSAKHSYAENVFEVENTRHHAGSPPPAFGFTEEDEDRSYPALHVRLSFEVGQEELRDDVAETIMHVLEIMCPLEEEDVDL